MRDAARPPTARVAGHEQTGRVDPAGQERLEDQHGVLEAGRERELGGQPEVGHEDLAAGPRASQAAKTPYIRGEVPT